MSPPIDPTSHVGSIHFDCIHFSFIVCTRRLVRVYLHKCTYTAFIFEVKRDSFTVDDLICSEIYVRKALDNKLAPNCRKNPRNAILRLSSFYMSFYALEHFVFIFFIIMHFNFLKLPIIIGSLLYVYGLGRVHGQNAKNVP